MEIEDEKPIQNKIQNDENEFFGEIIKMSFMIDDEFCYDYEGANPNETFINNC